MLHALRTKIGEEMKLYDPKEMHFSLGRRVSHVRVRRRREAVGRHAPPFTAPRDEHLALLDSDPGKCRAKAYDLVINGYEAGGGTIRIHDADVAKQGVRAAWASTRRQPATDSGSCSTPWQYGAPPHGGIALGIDRVVMLFGGLDNIRD